jgi:hypothetical protein
MENLALTVSIISTALYPFDVSGGNDWYHNGRTPKKVGGPNK